MRDRSARPPLPPAAGPYPHHGCGEGRPLQALMQILAGELETVERDIDTLYDNWFIETCEDWGCPIWAISSARLREFGNSLRAYVANTLSYRQGKGTRPFSSRSRAMFPAGQSSRWSSSSASRRARMSTTSAPAISRP